LEFAVVDVGDEIKARNSLPKFVVCFAGDALELYLVIMPGAGFGSIRPAASRSLQV
jgi:hypothetical protein